MSQPQKVVFFDGGCVLCSEMVQWIHRRDANGEIWFAALESDFAKEYREDLKLPNPGENAETLVFWERDKERVSIKSTGVLNLLNTLGGFWGGLSTLGRIVPVSLRDQVYDWVARNRRRWFGTNEGCALPPASLRGKVLS